MNTPAQAPSFPADASAASAANAALQTVVALTTDTRPGDTFSVGLSSQGQYGVDEGLIFSYPCRRHHGFIQRLGMEEVGIEVVEGWSFNDYAQEKFTEVLAELREERDAVKALGLLK